MLGLTTLGFINVRINNVSWNLSCFFIKVNLWSKQSFLVLLYEQNVEIQLISYGPHLYTRTMKPKNEACFFFRILKSSFRVFLFMAKLKANFGFREASTGPRLGVTSNLRLAQNLRTKKIVSSGKKLIQAIGNRMSIA